MKKIFLSVALLLFMLPEVAISQTVWNQSSCDVSFKIKNAGMGVTGRFPGITTNLLFSPDNLNASKLQGFARVGTINTGINKRDKDLQAKTYFFADSFNQISVVSESLYTKGTQYAGMFNVTIKGITKKVEIPFEFNQLGSEAEFKGTFKLNRRDFNVGGHSLILSDNLEVSLDIKAKR